jgi:Zn-dependent peptidase ImmA (M78 family)
LTRQHGVIAHEIGHWALWECGEAYTDDRLARYLAGALMLPYIEFRRDVRRADWDLDALRRYHPNASAEMVIVRMTQISESCAWVWDDGEVKRRYGAHEDEAVEAIINRVIAEGVAVHDGELRGWPRMDAMYRRVLVLRLAA